jgi:hypothetical protein
MQKNYILINNYLQKPPYQPLLGFLYRTQLLAKLNANRPARKEEEDRESAEDEE